MKHEGDDCVLMPVTKTRFFSYQAAGKLP